MWVRRGEEGVEEQAVITVSRITAPTCFSIIINMRTSSYVCVCLQRMLQLTI